jgi:RNA recognition motif-containing protein
MNIYVGNLSTDTNEDDLRQAFEAFGQVANVRIVRDGATGESRGFGFIEMPDEAQAKTAIQEMNGKELKGNALTVELGRSRTAGPGGGRPPRGQGGGSRGGRPGGRPGGRGPGGRPGGRGPGRGPSRGPGRGPGRGGDRGGPRGM